MIACLLLHIFRYLGDLLIIKILKGRNKIFFCQNLDILGSCNFFLKVLHALYNCLFNINLFAKFDYMGAILFVQWLCLYGQCYLQKVFKIVI